MDRRLLAALALAALALAACSRSPEAVSTPVTAPASAPAPPTAAEPPRKTVAWTPPAGPLAPPERAIVGTWVATVGDYATRSAFMADKVMFGLDGKQGNPITSIVDAIEHDNRVKTNCVWLEFNDDRSGIRRECALVNGDPSALDQNDLVTGRKRDLGTTFAWWWDAPSKSVRVRFDGDMLVPRADGKTTRMLRFRAWVLRFGAPDGERRKIKESFPEHDWALPVEYAYEIFPGRFLGKR